MKILLLAIRSLSHFRLYSWINIFGLALGLSCVILISRYVYSEWNTDHFNTKLERLTLVTFEATQGIPGVRFGSLDMYPQLQEEPGIEKVTTFSLGENKISYDNKEHLIRVLGVDTVFFQLMDYPLETGNRQRIMTNPNSVVISRPLANILFGKENPIGKTFSFANGETVSVEGIIGKPSTKSSISFDIVVSEALQIEKGGTLSYLLLHPDADIKEMNKRWESPVQVPEAMPGMGEMQFQFFPLKKLYFDTHVLKLNYFAQGDYNNILIFLATAIFILLVALFNYINIYMIIQQKRNKEFGLKKVFGAEPRYIIGQFLVENVILTVISLFFAWIFIEIAGMFLQSYFGIGQVGNRYFDGLLSAGILLLLPVVVAISPFLKYISTPSVTSLRAFLTGGKPGASRYTFLVLQYTVSIALFVISVFLMKQLHFIRNTDPGYRAENVIRTPFITSALYRYSGDDPQTRRQKEQNIAEYIAGKMNESTLFTRWQYANSPNNLGRITAKYKVEGDDFKECAMAYITNNYLQLYRFQLAEGNIWDETSAHTIPVPVIVNETAKKMFGIDNIRDATLHPENFMLLAGGEPVRNPPLKIIGVLKDFMIGHVSKATPPVVFFSDERGFSYYATLAATIAPGKRAEAIRFLQELHQETVGGEFTYTFIEDEINSLYENDRKTAVLYGIFTCIAIFISLMGLFGLSLFDIQQRYKEIAIRKINGATIPAIAQLLLNKYIRLLLVAFVIATPLTWLAISKYLENFAYKTSISWWLFALALLATGSISIATLIWQIRKAAQSNPIEAIKTE